MQTRWRGRPIRLHRPVVRNDQILVRVEPGSAARYLRAGTLKVSFAGFDPAALPTSMLALPALGTVLTVAIAAGVPVEVDEVDAEFAAGVDAMVPVWQRMHPRFRTARFAFNADRVATPIPVGTGDVLLWSGGLDSTASLLEHAGSISALFTVWGADVELRDAPLWAALNRHFDEDELAASIPRLTARSNMRHFPILHTLAHDFLAPGESWWGRVQHGLALAGLAAPATVAVGASGLIRASSFSPESHQPTGSMPELDALTRWAGVTVHHEGFELTRQGKITERLAPYLAGGGRLNLAVCYRRGRHDTARGLNCGDCEKCMRTAAGLLAAGIDPASVGVRIENRSYARWTLRLQDGLPLAKHALPFWREVTDALSAAPPLPTEVAAADFIRALSQEDALVPSAPRTDLADYRRNYRAKRRAVHVARLQASARDLVRTLRRKGRLSLAG